MKCKRHPSEHGSGVCAPCLCDRLLILLADQQHNRHRPSPQSSKKDTSTSPESPPSFPVADDGGRSTIRQSHRRFSLFPFVFASDGSETSSSWISSLIHRRRAKEQRVRSYGPTARGMSPATDGPESDGDASGSGCSAESPDGVRRKTTPARPTADRRRRRGGGGGLADFVVCLSPLVRPGPTGRRRRHRAPKAESGFSVELGRNGKPVRFGPNRSRKLADRGRFR